MIISDLLEMFFQFDLPLYTVDENAITTRLIRLLSASLSLFRSVRNSRAHNASLPCRLDLFGSTKLRL